MMKYGSIDYVKRFAKSIVEDSWKQVEKLLPDSNGRERLKSFTEFLIERKI
jgi:geranylgeranyl pyrophosphate synthase